MLLRRLAILLPLIVPRAVRAQDELECDNKNMANYLLGTIDGLYANGLTVFESLLVHISALENGYELLAQLYLRNDDHFTVLAPTDSAFQMAGVWAPFAHQSPEYLVNLFALHVVQGMWGHDELPSRKGGNGVAQSLLGLAEGMGAMSGTETGVRLDKNQSVVMRRGENGGVIIKTALGDVTSWASPVDLSWLPQVDNLRVLPIDHVLAMPPNISTALTLPTTTRSPRGLPLLRAAIGNVSATGADALAELSTGGLTFFAAVDDAWGGQAWEQVEDKDLRAKLLGNHYTTNATVFSPSWSNGTARDVKVMTGENLRLTLEGETSFVSLGDQKAQILRPDIVLENGVVHIIDKVLLVPSDHKSDPFVATIPPSSSTKPRTSSVYTVTQASTDRAQSGAGQRLQLVGASLSCGIAAVLAFAVLC